MQSHCLAGSNLLTGQFGLGVAVRLKTLNIPYVIVDKGKQVGDSWRTRYSVRSRSFDRMPTYHLGQVLMMF